MNPTVDQLAQAFAQEAAAELNKACGVIKHCLSQLSDEQIWQRSADDRNSIANLILHLCGNVRQWIVVGIGGGQDLRNRPGEFAQRGGHTINDLVQRLDTTLADAARALQTATASELLRSRSIQGFAGTGLAAIIHSISHFRGHTQEIVHLTRSLLGSAYRFDLVLP